VLGFGCTVFVRRAVTTHRCAAVASATVTLIGSVLLSGGVVGAFVQQPSALNRVVLRVPLQGGLNVTINGQGPFPFGFDTGASGDAWVTRALVNKLDLPTVGRMRVQDGSGVNSRDVETVRIETMRMGDASFERVRAPVLGDGPKKDDDPDVYGTLGFELFRDYLLTLDYPQNQLRVATGELPTPDGRTVFPYFVESGTPHIDIDVAGWRIRASIDSGSGGGLMLPRALADSLPLQEPLRSTGRVASSLGVFDLFQAKLAGDLNIGAFVFPQPVLFFSDLVNVPNVGRQIMRTFSVTFDQRNHRILLSRP
jgi:hypothetical protein